VVRLAVELLQLHPEVGADGPEDFLQALEMQVDWIEALPIHAAQYALMALEEAFDRFFKGLAGYPKPRKKFKHDSFTLPADDIAGFKRINKNVGKNVGAIKIPKIGWVKFRGWRDLGGKLVSVTFRLEAGRWYINAAWEKEIPDPPKSEFPQVGIDRSIAVFAALSDGRQYKPLNAFGAIRDKLAKLQRRLARKVKHSSN
jgi:putative transposase